MSADPWIELVPYEPRHRVAWDECVRRSRQPHFLFEQGFMDYHEARFQDRSLLVVRRGRILGVLPLAEENGLWISHPGLPFAGLISAPEIDHSGVVTVFDRLQSRMAAAGVSTLVYHAAPTPYRHGAGDENLYELERRQAVSLPSRISSVLRIGDPGLASATTLKRVRRARRAGLVVDRQVSPAEVLALAADTLHRRHQAKPLHTDVQMLCIQRTFPDGVQAWGVCSERGLEAGVIVFVESQVLRVQHMGYREDAPEGSVELVFSELQHEPSYQGRWLDFGTSMNPSDGSLAQDLLWYKERLGARMVLLRSYEWSPTMSTP